MSNAKQMLNWARQNVGDFFEEDSGQVDCTGLGEAIISQFDLDPDHEEDAFEMALTIADEFEGILEDEQGFSAVPRFAQSNHLLIFL